MPNAASAARFAQLARARAAHCTSILRILDAIVPAEATDRNAG
jgi:hypothetical protein